MMSGDIEEYNLQLIGCMLQRGLIGGNYLPVEYIMRDCKWEEIARDHKIRKGIKKVLKRLETLGLVNMHGKTRNPVASLTSEGVAVARDYLDL